MELLNIFSEFFVRLPEITEKVKPFAKNANLSTDEAFLLLAFYFSNNFEILANENVKQGLIEKKLVEYNGKSLAFSSKGGIIVKSIVNGLKR